MTIASLGIEVQSGQVKSGTVDLNRFEAAAKGAQAATSGLAATSRAVSSAVGQMNQTVTAEASAQDRATASTKMHTAALQAEAASAKMAGFQRRNLLFQLNDVGVSLASGMNPMMVLVQQGSQIATIYEGGVVPALKETAAMAGRAAVAFWPIGLAVAAVTAGVAGMTSEIDKSTKVSVSFGDVFKAVGQTLWDTFTNFIEPVTDKLGDMFSAAWDVVISVTKATMNYLINSVVGAVKTIGAVWNGLPAALADIGIVMANTIVTAFEGAINRAGDILNTFVAMANEVFPGLMIGEIGEVKLPKFANPFEGSKDKLGTNVGAIANENVDYMGGFYNDVRGHAIQNAIDRDKDAAKASKGAAKEAERQAEAYRDLVRGAQEKIAASELEMRSIGMTAEAANRLRYEQGMLNKAANDNIALGPAQRAEIAGLAAEMAAAEEATRRVTEIYNFGKDVFSGFFSDMKSGLGEGKSLWSSFADAAMNALDKIADKLMENATSGLWDMLFSGVMSGISGGFGGNPAGLGAGGAGFLGGGAGSWGPSFAGGGYTGSGSRSGGLDGQGGFMALLHPQETVTDHTRGAANQNQANDNKRGDLHVHINGSGLSEEQLGRAIASGIRDYDASLAPKVEAKFRTMQNDPRAADGGW